MKTKMRLTTFERCKRRALKDPRLRRAMESTDDDPFVETAYRLIALRRQKGWTQAQLAKMIGVSQQAVARLESLDYKGHSLQSLQKIAEACGKRLRVSFVAARDAAVLGLARGNRLI